MLAFTHKVHDFFFVCMLNPDEHKKENLQDIIDNVTNKLKETQTISNLLDSLKKCYIPFSDRDNSISSSSNICLNIKTIISKGDPRRITNEFQRLEELGMIYIKHSMPQEYIGDEHRLTNLLASFICTHFQFMVYEGASLYNIKCSLDDILFAIANGAPISTDIFSVNMENSYTVSVSVFSICATQDGSNSWKFSASLNIIHLHNKYFLNSSILSLARQYIKESTFLDSNDLRYSRMEFRKVISTIISNSAN